MNKIAVLEHKEHTEVFKITSADISITSIGVNARVTGARLAFYTRDYGVDDYPCNIDTLPEATQKSFIDLYIDKDGHFMSSKAYTQARKLNYKGATK